MLRAGGVGIVVNAAPLAASGALPGQIQVTWVLPSARWSIG
jgi:hypothetical protein